MMSGVRVGNGGRRIWRAVRWLSVRIPHPTRTPFTFWYLVILLGTTALLRFGGPRLRHHVLAWASTDAANLIRHPVQALLASALVLPGGQWAPYVLLFGLFVAPLERKIGWRWTLAVFASGHVIATLLTELPVSYAVTTHLLPLHKAYLIDVGVSYGFFTTAGALVPMLDSRVRWWALAGLDVFVGLILVGSGITGNAVMTAVGHLLALHVGVFGWWCWLRHRDLIGSVRLPRISRPRLRTTGQPEA